MSWLEAVFLGMIQGFTEFLPVSSSGHLVAFQNFLDLKGEQLTFDVVVHVATLLVVLTIYCGPICELLRDLFRGLKERKRNNGTDMFGFVFVASIPTGLMGLFLRDYWSTLFATQEWVGVFLIVTGFILLSTRKRSKSVDSLADSSLTDLPTDSLTSSLTGSLSWKKALIIGTAQGFAILPGISRSGTTIAVALLLGIERQAAAFISFMLMIPAVLGATVLQLSSVNWSEIQSTPLLIGFIAAYLSGVLGLLAILKLVKRGRLELFTPYLWLVGSGLLLYTLFQ